jgi:CBS domain-containing protein
MKSQSEQLTVGEICMRDVVFAYPNMSVSEAARLMREEHVGSLVVVSDTEQKRLVVGMLTDRDIALAAVAAEHASAMLRVADIMSKNLVITRPEDSMHAALGLMRHHGVRRLPVTDADGALIGIVALDDLLDILAEELQGLVQVIAREKQRESQVRI